MANKYRVNGKFVSFKEFIKSNGLDAVVYDKLSKKQKQVWNGLNSYENRAVLKSGKFANKTLTDNPTIKQFARSRGETLAKYIKDNEDAINKFMSQGLINRSVNTNSLHEFILSHKGNIVYKGKVIDKNEFLILMDLERAKAMKTGNTVEIVYNFEVSKNGTQLKLKDTKKIKSPKKKKGGPTDEKSGV